LAPDLVVAEVGNAVWKCVRQGRITADQYTRASRALPNLFDELVPLAGLNSRAWDIAATLNHPVYDAFYLALAELREAVLITADNRLLTRVRGSEWAPHVRRLGE
jgi:predicted nucleic acid-binding protein